MVSGTDKRGPQLCRYREDEVGSRRGKKKKIVPSRARSNFECPEDIYP